MLRAIGGDFIVGGEFVRRICTSCGGALNGGGRRGVAFLAARLGEAFLLAVALVEL